jgi:predicted tellurium resistance membrane protein TerC
MPFEMMDFFDPLFTIQGLISLLTLSVLEIVLGIDNLIFISILAGRLAVDEQKKSRNIGLSLALIMRVILLFLISWIVGFSKPVIKDFFGAEVSVRDIILFAGGMFLIYKSTFEIHEKLEGAEMKEAGVKGPSLLSVVIQIVLLDLVFSFDSILTAIGLVNDPHRDLSIMVAAIIIAMVIMILFVRSISDFINRHPTIKMLALSFLLMIGLLLVVEAFHIHVPKGYVYFAMAFSLFVEILNMRVRKTTEPVKLKSKYPKEKKEL